MKQLTKKGTNRKQKKFVKKVIETGHNIRKATDLAGYEPGYGYHLMKQPKIQNEIQLALERAGLTNDSLADGIKEGQEATYVKKDKGKAYPDYHARHKYYDMQVKIEGGYAPEKHEIKQEKLVVVLSPELRKGLLDAEAMTEDEMEVVEADVIEEERSELK